MLLRSNPLLLLAALVFFAFVPFETNPGRHTEHRAPVPQGVLPVGVGIVSPHLTPEQPLYFYSVRDYDTMPYQLTPVDSLTFKRGDYHIDIATAPPWFVPESFKLDYDLLTMRAKTLARQWIEVVVNQQTGETRWVSRQAVDFQPWPDFLLNVVAVEVPNPDINPIRARPFEAASVVAKTTALLQPLAVQGEWLQVGPSMLGDEAAPKGWIRWTDGERLLLVYSLLS